MGGSRISAAASALALAVSIFLLIPSTLYQQNPESLDLLFGNFYLIGAVLALAATVVLTGVALLLPRLGLAKVYLVLAIAIALKTLFLPSSVPVLDGDAAFTPFLTMAGLWSLASLLLVLAVAVAAVYYFKLGAGLILVLTLAFTLQPLLDTRNWAYDSEAFSQESSTPSRFMSFSADQQNVLIVLFDTFSSDVFAEVVEEDEALQEALRGFTHFYNTLTYSPYTMMSMMTIYSGREYDKGPLRDYYAKARQDSLFTDFEAAGGHTQLAGYRLFGLCPAQECWGETDIISIPPAEATITKYAELLEIGTLRLAPTFAHGWLYNAGQGHLQALVAPHRKGRGSRSVAALASFKDGLNVQDGPPTLKFFHLMTTHSPLILDEDCSLVSERSHQRKNYKAQVTCAVRGFAELLEAMKQAGIYDNTTIVLLGDHGGSVGKSEPRRFFGKVPTADGPRGRLIPVFAIKPKGAAEPFALSAAPARLPDLRKTLCGIAVECEGEVPGEDVFVLKDDADRKRELIDYKNREVSRYVGQHGVPPEGAFVHYSIGSTLEDLEEVYDRDRVKGEGGDEDE